jgi:predicted O-linked N-acetylglucosamine transferase (SPINDLY family)
MLLDINSELRNAQAAYRMQRYQEAMAACEAILAVEARNRAAHELFALACLGMGRPQLAAEHLVRATDFAPEDLELRLLGATALVRADRGQEALQLLRRCAAQRPGDPRVAFQLAVTLQGVGEPEEAIRNYRIAVRLAPGRAEIHNNLGAVLAQQGQHDEARRSYESALRADPGYVRAYNNLGKLLQEMGRSKEAVTQYQQALSRQPAYPEALTNLGVAYRDLGRLAESVDCHRQAIALRENLVAPHYNLGNVLLAMRRPEAISSFERAVALNPGFIDAWVKLGTALAGFKRHQPAIEAFRSALRIFPQHPECRWELGNALADAGEFPEALAIFESLLREDPREATLYFNCGRVLMLSGLLTASPARFAEAARRFQGALDLAPGYALARVNLAMALGFSGQTSEARAHVERAVQDDPDLKFGWCRLPHQRASIADWRDHEAHTQRLAQLAEVEEASVDPWLILNFIDDPFLQQRCARVHTRTLLGPRIEFPPASRNRVAGPLRVAYLSMDFREHPLGFSIVELLERHDRSRVDPIAIAYGPGDSGGTRSRISAAVSVFCVAEGWTDLQIAQRIRDLDVDIVVDLAGLVGEGRPQILAQRPAPLQVSYLGYAGTTGAEWMDYVLADQYVIPPALLEAFDESVIWLPESFFPSDTTVPIAGGDQTRAQAQLPEAAVVYCCFNQFERISPRQFDSWMNILRAVPGSVLWLRAGGKESGAEAEDNLRREAATRDVDPQRLIFAPVLGSRLAHLQRHRLADLFLDTYPYNSHSTARDALWAGLPVLTRSGHGMASRVAGSLLTALGMPELIVGGVEDYEALAIALGREPARIRALKAKLAVQRSDAALFNTQQLARHIELAYEQIHARWARGEHSSLLKVDSLAT